MDLYRAATEVGIVISLDCMSKYLQEMHEGGLTERTKQ